MSNSNPFYNSSPMYGPGGYQKLTVGAVAASLSVPEKATGAAITIESSDPNLSLCIRYNFGFNPSSADGNPLYDAMYMELNTLTAINDIRLISTDGNNHVVHVQYYN